MRRTTITMAILLLGCSDSMAQPPLDPERFPTLRMERPSSITLRIHHDGAAADGYCQRVTDGTTVPIDSIAVGWEFDRDPGWHWFTAPADTGWNLIPLPVDRVGWYSISWRFKSGEHWSCPGPVQRWERPPLWVYPAPGSWGGVTMGAITREGRENPR